MFCGKCGNEVLAGYQFCMKCGYDLSKEQSVKTKWKARKKPIAVISVFVFCILILILAHHVYNKLITASDDNNYFYEYVDWGTQMEIAEKMIRSSRRYNVAEISVSRETQTISIIENEFNGDSEATTNTNYKFSDNKLNEVSVGVITSSNPKVLNELHYNELLERLISMYGQPQNDVKHSWMVWNTEPAQITFFNLYGVIEITFKAS